MECTTRRNPPLEYYQESITSFVERPYPIETFLWASARSQGAVLAAISLPDKLLSIPAVSRKVENFSFFSFDTIEIEMRLNSTAFHYGKIMMFYIPCGRNGIVGQTAAINLATGSSSPHVQVSANSAEVTTMSIPYTLPYTYVDLTDLSTEAGVRKYNVGTLYVMVLNPLLSSSPSVDDVEVTIFARFAGAAVTGPTSKTYTITSPALPTDDFSNPFSAIPASDQNILYRTLAPAALARIEKLRKTRVEEAEAMQTLPVTQGLEEESEQKSEQGMISSTLAKVSSVAAAFSSVPLIGGIAGQVAGVTGVLATGAEGLGFSKPGNQRVPEPMVPSYMDLAHCHGLFNGHRTALKNSHMLEPCHSVTSGCPTEMSLVDVCTTPGLLATAPWEPTVASGQLIYQTAVSPLAAVSSLSSGSTYNVFFTPVGYVSLAHTSWRGSLRYHVEVVASTFHSGRLRIIWTPDLAFPTAESTVDSSNQINTTIDIKTSTEADIIVPYQQPSQFLDVSANESGINGYLVFQVLNRLVSTTTTPPKAFVNIYMSAGPDFLLTRPTAQKLTTTIPTEAARVAADTTHSDVVKFDLSGDDKSPSPKYGPSNFGKHHASVDGDLVTIQDQQGSKTVKYYGHLKNLEGESHPHITIGALKYWMAYYATEKTLYLVPADVKLFENYTLVDLGVHKDDLERKVTIGTDEILIKIKDGKVMINNKRVRVNNNTHYVSYDSEWLLYRLFTTESGRTFVVFDSKRSKANTLPKTQGYSRDDIKHRNYVPIVPSHAVDVAKYATTDCTSSVKEIVARPSRYGGTTDNTFTGDKRWSIGPLNRPPSRGGTDFLYYFSRIFRFYRGGFRVQMVSQHNRPNDSLGLIALERAPTLPDQASPVAYSSFTESTIDANNGQPRGAIYTPRLHHFPLQADIPYYTGTFFNYTEPYDLPVYAFPTSRAAISLQDENTSAVDSYYVLVSAADDFQYSFQIGVPPLLISLSILTDGTT